MTYQFKKARWVKSLDDIWRFKCNDAVYGWIEFKNKTYNYKAALFYQYGTPTGKCETLVHAKKLVEIMVLGTDTTLYQQQIKRKGEE